MRKLSLFLMIFTAFLSFENFVLAEENEANSENEIKKAIVEIVSKCNDYFVSGTGFIASPDGWTITNCHVVDDFFRVLDNRIIVKFYDKTECEAIVINCLEDIDVALLKLDCKNKNFSFIKIYRGKIKENEDIFLINSRKKESCSYCDFSL